MEPLKHECGVAMVRLLKPLEHYLHKYGTWAYGFSKLYLMMEKQHNRGQEGAGMACVNIDAPAGTEYTFREKAEGAGALKEIFSRITPDMAGQLYMGHLRYSTTGKNGLKYVHPFMRRSNWRSKTLCLCGNFNMTNIDEVFHLMTQQGQSPRSSSDTHIALDLMGHRLDREVERRYQEAVGKGLHLQDITRYTEQHLSVADVLKASMPLFDGGYVMCGLTGSGEMFAVRDPWGIRPAFYYADDEVVVVASERPVIQTCFSLEAGDIEELQPGQAVIVHQDGCLSLEQVIPPRQRRACSFERIYFSRGSDLAIYQERKQLGRQLTPSILQAIGGDVANTVFSYIPNTAEVAFFGMTDGLRRQYPDVRAEKVVWKDIKLRTFITEDAERRDLAAHVYDVSYGSLRPYKDNLVIIDDSIVRGTTLRESILKILDRLHPRKIVMVSSAPQIRYPDYYGIDMSHLEELCAFRAAIALLHERGMQRVIYDTYRACLEDATSQNHVRAIYAPFSAEEITGKIAEMLRPEGMETEVQLVFQSIEGLHSACPDHLGDWYFTGDYPTPGGLRKVNQAFVEYYENNSSEERTDK